MFKKGDTCSFSHVELAQGDLCGEWSEAKKDDRLLLHPNRKQSRLTERDKKPQWDQAVKKKALLTRVKFHADSNSVRHASCKLWHHPVCSK